MDMFCFGVSPQSLNITLTNLYKCQKPLIVQNKIILVIKDCVNVELKHGICLVRDGDSGPARRDDKFCSQTVSCCNLNVFIMITRLCAGYLCFLLAL